MKQIAGLILSAGAILLVANLVPGVSVAGFWTAVLVAILWGICMVLVRPILVLLTLPINIITLGLFIFVINALIFWFLGSILENFEVASFSAAFWGALLLSFLYMLIDKLLWPAKRNNA
jgi:putative membrane protein